MDIPELKQRQAIFRTKFQELKKAKDTLLKLFRKKLEEKKIEEIKQNISNITQNNI